MTITGTLSRAALLAVALAFGPAPAHALDPAPDAYNGGVLDTVSRALFTFDQYMYAGLSKAGQWLSGPVEPAAVEAGETAQSTLGRGIGNVTSNLVNEPVTAVAGLAVGSFDKSWHATKRFAINSTVGVLGWYDVADAWGLPRRHEDVGLLMCRAGVGEGGYVVLPLVGPRTIRDAGADIVLTSAVLLTITGVALGDGLTLQTFLVAETIEIAADIFATRQMDSHAAELNFDDYDRMREAYLAQRRARCADLDSADLPPPAPSPKPVRTLLAAAPTF